MNGWINYWPLNNARFYSLCNQGLPGLPGRRGPVGETGQKVIDSYLRITSRENQISILISPGPYLAFFVCGRVGFHEILDQYRHKKYPSKLIHYVRKKKTFGVPDGSNSPLCPDPTPHPPLRYVRP